jgi:hypothetical protein
MADDIGPGDIVQCIKTPVPHRRLPCWAFPPETGSIWTVEAVFPVAVDVRTGTLYAPGGIRLVGDVLPEPACWPTDRFRKLCGPPDAALLIDADEGVDAPPVPVDA